MRIILWQRNLILVHLHLQKNIDYYSKICILSGMQPKNGAPTVHPKMPFGSNDVLGDIARIINLTNNKPKKKLFGLLGKGKTKLSKEVEKIAQDHLRTLLPSMRIFLAMAKLEQGDYTLKVRSPQELNPGISQYDFLESTRQNKLVVMKPPLLKDNTKFNFNTQHLTLLRHAADMLEVEEEPDDGFYSVPMLDPKRPYGDMTYYPIDIAEVLNIPFDQPNYSETDEPPFKINKLEKLIDIHFDLFPALLVFLQNAKIKYGTYQRDKNYKWQLKQAFKIVN